MNLFKHLLNAHYMPGTELDSRYIKVVRTSLCNKESCGHKEVLKEVSISRQY